MPVRVFARVDTARVPDESTICQFRHWLEQPERTPTFLVRVRDHLKAHGLIIQTGPMVDTPIISALRSTKNKAIQPDPEIKSTKKGYPWPFGQKVHVGTVVNGLVHTAVVTPAKVHNSTVMEECWHGGEDEIYGDRA